MKNLFKKLKIERLTPISPKLTEFRKFRRFDPKLLILLALIINYAYADIKYVTNNNGDQDGHVYDASGGDGPGTGADTTSDELNVGEGTSTQNRVYYGLIGINVGSIPPGSTVTTATLFVYYAAFSGSQPDICSLLHFDGGDFGPTIEASDFENFTVLQNDFATEGTSSPGRWIREDATSVVNYAVSNAKGWSLDGSSYWAQFRIRPDCHLLDDGTSDRARMYTFENGSYIAYLKIEYTPSGAHITITKNNVPAYDFYAKQTNRTVMAFKVQDETPAHTLKAVRIKNAGNMVQSTDISNVKLYRDNNKDNWWDSSDTFIGYLKWSSAKSSWTNDNLSAAWTNYVITLNIANTPTIGRNFKGIIPKGGIRCSAGFTNETAITNANFQTVTNCPVVTHVVISEIQVAGDGGSDDEFIELYNPTSCDVDMSGWSIQYRGGGAANWSKKNFTAGAIIHCHGYYLIARSSYNGTVTPDIVNGSFTMSGTASGGTVALVTNQITLGSGVCDSTSILDKLGYGTGADVCPETTAFTPTPDDEEGLERKSDIVHNNNEGNGYDTDDNSNDFYNRGTSDPQNSSSSRESPACSGESHYIAVTKLTNIPTYSLFASETRKTVMSFRIIDSYGDALTGVRITNSGTMNSIDIDKAELWIDENNNHWYDAGDTKVADLTWSAGKLQNTAIAGGPTLSCPGVNFVVTIDLTAGARDNTTFQGTIRPNAITCGGGINGPANTIKNNLVQVVNPTTYPPGSVIINEIAWGGTTADEWDEWIELYNTTCQTVYLAGWTLVDSDGENLPNYGPQIYNLFGYIPPRGYYLIESDNTFGNATGSGEQCTSVPSDLIVPLSLANDSDWWDIKDGAGNVIDSAGDTGWNPYPGGANGFSMERIDPWTSGDVQANWGTNDGITRNGTDSNGDPINGTPKSKNSIFAGTGNFKMTNSYPTNNAINIPVNTSVTLTFTSDNIDMTTVNTNTFYILSPSGSKVQGSYAKIAGTYDKVYFTPSASLSFSTKYTVYVKSPIENDVTCLWTNYRFVFTTIPPSGPVLSIIKSISNIRLGGVLGNPIPGATITYQIKITNTGSASASNVIIYDKIAGNTVYVTNSSSSMSGWTNQYSTNTNPNQDWSSGHYTTFQPAVALIKWLRWKKVSVANAERAIFYFKVTIK